MQIVQDAYYVTAVCWTRTARGPAAVRAAVCLPAVCCPLPGSAQPAMLGASLVSRLTELTWARYTTELR